jgi:nucleotide-binding universal stress UspA family protein
MIRLNNILVATDFSKASDVALAYGRDLARSYGSALHVLHVAENAFLLFGGDPATTFVPDQQLEIERSAREQVEALITDDDRTMLRATSAVVTGVGVAQAIVDYVSAHGIDLVIMGTHGRGAVAHLLMGSVAERVVRLAPCPVLTVRSPERDFVVPDELAAVARA